jgi:hypothetical protein
MSSITDNILYDEKERNRLSKYALIENPDIQNFEDFEIALNKAFERGNGQNLTFDSEDVKRLWEAPIIQENIVSENPEEKKDNEIIIRVRKEKAKKPKLNQKWTPLQEHFLKVRKKKGLQPKEISEQYNQSFKDSPRTEKSISDKIYKI